MTEIDAKNRIADLAIFGGPCIFREKKHVGRPNIGNRQKFLSKVNELLDRNWLTNDGPNVKEFEEKIARYLGVRHCIAVSNGTMALMIAAKAAGLEGEVIVPSFTFVATAHALQWQGITPVFCDIEPQYCMIDPNFIESLITERTTGILGVHLWGFPCHIDALTEIARKYDLKLIFDAAHAFGCSADGQMIGTFGDAEILSFHATKFFHTLEGGAVVTQDDELADRVRLMRNFGFQGADNVVSIGINAKMEEISAAMGLTNLHELETIIDYNKRNYEFYKRKLQTIPGIELKELNGGEKNNFQYIVIMVDEENYPIKRDQLVAVLQEENILARRYFYPGCHKLEPYRSLAGYRETVLPVTDKIARQVICLPTGTSVSIGDVEKICDIINFVACNGEEINKILANIS